MNAYRAALVALLLLPDPCALATTLVVATDGSGDYSSIHAAVSASADGDTILVRAGAYTEGALTLGPQDLTVLGDGADVTFVRSTSPYTGLLVTAGSLELRGFRLEIRLTVESGAYAVIAENVIRWDVEVVGNAKLERNLLAPTQDSGVLEVHAGAFDTSIERNIFYYQGYHNGRYAMIYTGTDIRDAISCNVVWPYAAPFVHGFDLEPPANGNMRLDPLFCDPHLDDYDMTNDDLRLLDASSCAPGQGSEGVGCGLVGPFGVGCVSSSFYAYRVAPSTASYAGPRTLTVHGVGFPAGVTFTMRSPAGVPFLPTNVTATDTTVTGDVDLWRALVGDWDLFVEGPADTFAMQDRFAVLPGVITAVSPDTIPALDDVALVRISGGPFTEGFVVDLLNQGGIPMNTVVVYESIDSLVVRLRPGENRGFGSVRVENWNHDVIRADDAFWLDDRRRELITPSPEYPTLQEAIDWALEGDTISVESGEWLTSAEVDGKNLTIRAREPGNATLRGVSGGGILRLVDVDERTLITGLTFLKGRTANVDAHGGGIDLRGSARIVGNRFVSNSGCYAEPEYDSFEWGGGGGIWCVGAATIEDNVFEANRAGESEGGSGVGAQCAPDDTVRIVGNVFVDNVVAEIDGPETRGNSIHIRGGNAIVARNTIWHGETSGDRAVGFFGDANVVFVNNVLVGSTSNYYVTDEFLHCETTGSVVLDCNAVSTPDLTFGCPGQPSGEVLEVDPLFCDPPLDLTISLHSPIHPDSTSCGQIGALGVGCALTPIQESNEDQTSPVPTVFRLGAPTPNPFNPTVRLSLAVPVAGRLRAVLYDVAGRRVRTLADDILEPGAYVVTWDGRLADGRIAASGIYFLRVHADGFTTSRRLVLSR